VHPTARPAQPHTLPAAELLGRDEQTGDGDECVRTPPQFKKTRKQILRQMKKLSGKIEGHARAHLRLLKQKRECTG
jgi:hypothetical protein